MIDYENLRTASLYINNQLLSRGLIRDGDAINFTDFGERGLGSAHSASRIIRILNDLIIRRDRDAEQRQSFSNQFVSLRAENLKHTNDIARLSEKCTEAQRRSDIAAMSEASLKTQLKSAESAMKGLKDDLARTKGLVAQTRASCATEIRRRDRQIETLKKQVGEAGRARGTKSGSGILSITVTGDVGSEEKRSSAHGGNLEDKDYSLRSETNTFLASLAQNLSEENEALMNAMQKAKSQLREMSGWGGEEREESEVAKPQGWEEISAELGAVMNHMRNLLTNPSFVPIEEVMVREEEIGRLKAAMTKMENRWEDADLLMDGWRKRMATSGTPIGEDDIRMILHLSPVRMSGVEKSRSTRERDLPAVEEKDEPEEDIYGNSDGETTGSSGDADNDNCDLDDYDMEAVEDDVEEPEPDKYMSGAEEAAAATDDMRQSTEPEQLPEQLQPGPLQYSSSAGNRGPHDSTLRQKLGTSAVTMTRGSQRSAGTASTETARQTSGRITRPLNAQTQRSVASSTAKPEERTLTKSTTFVDEALLPINAKEMDKRPIEHAPSRSGGATSKAGSLQSNPRRMPARSEQPRPNGARPQPASPSKTVIAAKLAASEKQAEAARNHAKLRALRTLGGAQRSAVASGTGPSRLAAARAGTPTANSARGLSPVKRDVAQSGVQKPEIRKRERRVAKVTSRRRSTLSPFELQSLISGNVE
ncbi:Afadin and alpha-actinin-binding domain-containing protein [Trichoderma barbatum]